MRFGLLVDMRWPVVDSVPQLLPRLIECDFATLIRIANGSRMGVGQAPPKEYRSEDQSRECSNDDEYLLQAKLKLASFQ
jgi:hypothetical protein